MTATQKARGSRQSPPTPSPDKDLRCKIGAEAHEKAKTVIDRYGSDWRTFLTGFIGAHTIEEIDAKFVESRRNA
jgi:hypothetical protein